MKLSVSTVTTAFTMPKIIAYMVYTLTSFRVVSTVSTSTSVLLKISAEI